MTDEKPKNDQEKDKRQVTEWSFDFSDLGDKISEFVSGLGIKGEEQIKHGEFSTPIDNAQSANVRIDLSVGEANINALTDSDNLLEADLMYVGEIKFVSSGEQEKMVSLSQDASGAEWFRNVFGWIGSGQKLKWDIGLTPHIPLDIEVRGGVGRATLNLGTIQPKAVRVHTGAGEVIAVLPAAANHYRAELHGGVGRSQITVPDNTDLELQIHAGTGETNLEVGVGSSVQAQMRGGVGGFNLRIPADAAVRLEVRSGIGGVRVPSRFIRTSAQDEFLGKGGVWETPGFDSAEHKIAVRYEMGVGGLEVSEI